MDEQNDEGTTSKAAASNGVERRQRASDFRPEVLKLFDEYVHGAISRRTFLERAAAYAVTGIGAGALLEALSPNFAYAQVPADEPRIETEVVEFKSPKGNGRVRGYLARPKRRHGDLPVVLVAHENRGLNPHIEDITRRLALENFLAFAPDALSPLGGYPGNEDKARELFATLDQAKTREDFLAAAQFIGRHRDSNRRLGAVGFCWGGGTVNFLATKLPELIAAVPFYGPAPAPEQAARVKATLQVHLADVDARVNDTWPPYEAALSAAHARFEIFRYPNTQHGFNNDTTPRYDAAAAKLAWERTLALFNRELRKPKHGEPPT
ncbi:MAG TPA: dienelactone hydrolase family protein [Polyangiaceae bacterium]|nr:dienelactone hydrolase family protein [Polyangiaceae bacterium]